MQPTQGRGGQQFGMYERDPATGEFVTEQEAAQSAQQYPQQVQQGYARNIPLSVVGLPESGSMQQRRQTHPSRRRGGQPQGQYGQHQPQQGWQQSRR